MIPAIAQMNSAVARMNSEVAQMNSEVAEMKYLCREMISPSAGISASDGGANFYFEDLCHGVHGEEVRIF